MGATAELLRGYEAPDRVGLPGVVVSATAFGPRARPEGTRLDVWFLLDALANAGSAAEVAEHFAVPVEVVWAAVAYGREFPARVDAERDADRAAGLEVERRYKRAG
jgi:uncharacterized protein (DUF433 family)